MQALRLQSLLQVLQGPAPIYKQGPSADLQARPQRRITSKAPAPLYKQGPSAPLQARPRAITSKAPRHFKQGSTPLQARPSATHLQGPAPLTSKLSTNFSLQIGI